MQLHSRLEVARLYRAQPVARRHDRLGQLAQLAQVVGEDVCSVLDLVAPPTEECETLRVRRQRRHAQLIPFGFSLEPVEQLVVERATPMSRMDLVPQRRLPYPRPGHGL